MMSVAHVTTESHVKSGVYSFPLETVSNSVRKLLVAPVTLVSPLYEWAYLSRQFCSRQGLPLAVVVNALFSISLLGTSRCY